MVDSPDWSAYQRCMTKIPDKKTIVFIYYEDIIKMKTEKLASCNCQNIEKDMQISG